MCCVMPARVLTHQLMYAPTRMHTSLGWKDGTHVSPKTFLGLGVHDTDDLLSGHDRGCQDIH